MAAPKLIQDYPTPHHAAAAQKITNRYKNHSEVQAILLVNSCARGKATKDSCLDIAILVSPENFGEKEPQLLDEWESFYQSEPVFKELAGAGVFSEVHLDFIDGEYIPTGRDFTSGPDDFEVAIGNHLAYSIPLHLNGLRLETLKSHWLPYYPEDLREQRLTEALYYFHNNLNHIPLYAQRGLHFQCFNRFYDAFKEFLQLLFISRRVYPIAYDKWIYEQIVEILELPQLYVQITELLEVHPFNGNTIAGKASQLKALLANYVIEEV